MKQYESIATIFDDPHPQIMAVIADPNQGKSNALHAMARYMQERYSVNVTTYGLQNPIAGAKVIYSVPELESVQNSIVFLDEFYTLFELNTNRKNFALLEKSMRTIYHPHVNNIWVLVGLPQNFNKFISGKLSKILYKRCTLVDFINGSMAKAKAFEYRGSENGASILNIAKDETILWDSEGMDKRGEAYTRITIPYIRDVDSKLSNPPIFSPLKPVKASR